MSGGSYNYFYSRAPDELRSMASTLQAMAEKCERSATEKRMHWETKEPIDMLMLAEVGAYLRLLGVRLAATGKMLDAWEHVMHNVEWWQSGDSGPEEVLESFRKLVPGPAPEPSKEP